VTRVLVHGGGKMGQGLVAVLQGSSDIELAGVVCEPRPQDLPEPSWYPAFPETGAGIDLVIDFTLTGGPAAAAAWCEKQGVALLSGTTALSDADREGLENAAGVVPVLWAPNLSFGIAMMNKLLRQAVSALGGEANIHITETHHVHKLDAPSGTALALAETARQARPEDATEITFKSLREGEVVGEHTVRLAFGDEVLEIRHQALDRDIFVHGALKAGAWLVQQPPGYYTAEDWLGRD
jgi:4-hydroxy-tetrahydrodipicolinate reductase